jgi:ATP-binding cassette subfamily B protein
MLSIQYIIGQLNSPIEQFIQFIRSFQDARISLERINEIHAQEDEMDPQLSLREKLPADHSVVFKNVSFAYPGAGNTDVLKGIDLYIPEGKTTAIVGMSGSGKTTLLKLFLKFYAPKEGYIHVGGMPLDRLHTDIWRGQCGVVMQDGFIFADSIASNITMKKEGIDMAKLEYAAKVANINDYIASLPLGYNTRIGLDGLGLSQGQRQRILIARAVYKDPAFILFDEATNSLDANNEKVIMQNLEAFFRNRTVIVVAHRLSTVKHADQIIVLNKGVVKETGTHEELTNLKGQYFELVKNQLELDK